ncbi:MAG: hypothetical protein ACLPX5_06755 [Dissulfurispiraceae bacterium]
MKKRIEFLLPTPKAVTADSCGGGEQKKRGFNGENKELLKEQISVCQRADECINKESLMNGGE